VTEPNEQRDGSPTAVIYLRVSTKEQAQRDGDPEGYSIPAQREACKRKVASLGGVVVEEFADRGASATSAKRPGLQRMLTYVKENEVAYVIVHKVDRLARNRVDDVEINLALKAAGATLVSCSENIDATPSGMLLHGIMSSIAEFYSRNLASEILKGSVQKAKTGGTVGKAPLGYLNVRTTVDGQEARTVEIDAVRGPLVKWALESYATGDWSLNGLLDEVTRRGLETTGTAKRPPSPLHLSHLHRIVTHPYYKGVVRYRGIEYAGRHQPLITPETWQRNQDVLRAHYLAGERQRTHNHYLKGSVFCGYCNSRLIITNARNRHGKVYPYFVCAGRHQKRTDCTFRAILIETVERKVAAHYVTQQLAPAVRDALEHGLTDEFQAFHKEVAAEQKLLGGRKQQLLNERSKLLHAHYAEAIPLDLLKTEQTRITSQLAYIEQRFEDTDDEHAKVLANLERILDIATDLETAYASAAPTVRRQFNQAIFKRLYICEDGEIRSELAQPFDTLLNHALHDRATSLPAKRVAKSKSTEQPDWLAWEASFNEDTHEEGLVGVGTTRRPLGRLGLTNESMVEAGGIEPPSVSRPD
jgi:site-specific DNA recombinase